VHLISQLIRYSSDAEGGKLAQIPSHAIHGPQRLLWRRLNHCTKPGRRNAGYSEGTACHLSKRFTHLHSHPYMAGRIPTDRLQHRLAHFGQAVPLSSCQTVRQASHRRPHPPQVDATANLRELTVHPFLNSPNQWRTFRISQSVRQLCQLGVRRSSMLRSPPIQLFARYQAYPVDQPLIVPPRIRNQV
jgi:hypothetical protein